VTSRRAHHGNCIHRQGPGALRHQDLHLPRRRGQAVAGIPQAVREPDQRGAGRGHALGTFRPTG
jgi:hypothetical protein